MKQYFPFTDYDFYAYLTAGAGLLFAIDLTFNDAAITRLPEWTVVKIGLVTALAYVVGQLAASVSSLIFEHWIARRVLYSPLVLQLAFRKPRRRERVIAKYVVGRYYEALPVQMRNKIFKRCGEAFPGGAPEQDMIYQWAFLQSRRSSDVAARLDAFLKLYGFNRNLALVAAMATLLFLGRAVGAGEKVFFLWSGLALVIAVGCFARFLKFYTAFTAEVLRGSLQEAGDKPAASSSMDHGTEDL